MTNELAVRVRGGGTLWVPRSASYLSTYVLLEQEGWFEKEITFVRRVLRPGMRAIDVGANFGCYSVAMSHAVGCGGMLWLYEPTTTTFEYLRRTLGSNGLTWAHAHRLALSDREGTATLGIGDNSELNSLGQNNGGNAEETVSLTTLDRARVIQSIESVDFVKLDAEGAEVQIVAGGEEFFHSEDPLVMFEVKHGATINTELPRSFERLGYRLYRLVGPDTMLVPTSIDEQLDDYELNLFACKPGRAARLEADGDLIDATVSKQAGRSGEGLELWRAQPFAAAFAPGIAPRDPLYASALDNYAVWRDGTRKPAQRYFALATALRELIDLTGRTTTLPRLFMLVRIALEAGARAVAVENLQRINRLLGSGHQALDEPCWPALRRYEALSPSSGAAGWLTASAGEALVIASHYSGYFSGPTFLPVLDWLHGSPYASAPMERRRQLQAIFAGRQRQVEDSAILQRSGEDNLNPQLWVAGADIFGVAN